MLELAYLHKKFLKAEYVKSIRKPENFYYFLGPYRAYELIIDKNSWDNLQFVSVSRNGKREFLNGYLCANIDNVTDHITGLQFLKFQRNNNIFAHDLVKFLEDLFEKYNFRKIEWSVVIGNPAEKMYDRIISKWGGKIIGIFRKHVKLSDGNLYDLKYYEIFKENYDKEKIFYFYNLNKNY